MIYLDTSAAVKLVIPEAESTALELWIAERVGLVRASSRLLRIELLHAVGRVAPHRLDQAHLILSGILQLSVDDAASTAETIGDPFLRSLDAIHLATAYGLRDVLTAFVTYDKRLFQAATALGLPVEAPS